MSPRHIPAAILLSIAAPATAQHAMGAEVRAAASVSGIGASAAIPATRIEPDTAPPLSLGTQVTRAGNVTTIDGGTRAGANLFHSFARFDLAFGDVARWTYSAGDPAAIRNVVSRVTGGQPSSIYGTIDGSALPNADFWFVNPAGILFGQGASINVPCAAHFSTAQELRFDSGPAFAVTTPGGSTFSVASPAAFGFLGNQGSIVVQGADRSFVAAGGRLSLVASDVTLSGSDIAGGRIALIGAGTGVTSVRVANPLASPLAGAVRVEDSVLRLNGAPGAGRGLVIGGGTVDVRNSDVGTDFLPGPDQGVSAPIDIAGGDVTIFSSLVSSATFGGEPAGDIRISGKSVHITAISVVSSNARFGSTGPAGLISIAGDDVRIDDRAFVSSSTQTAQSGGEIILQGGKIAISGGVVATDALAQASGDAGAIQVRGASLSLDNGATISSQSGGTGKGGAVSVKVSGPVALSRGSIRSDAFDGPGNAGSIDIEADRLSLLDQGQISSATFTSGDGGRIAIKANALSLDQSTISTSSAPDASGRAGSIGIDVGKLDLANASSIATDTDNATIGGTIRIGADSIRLAGSSISSTNAFELLGSGAAAGSVSISARSLSLIEGGEISTSATGGAAGDIDIRMPSDGLLTLTGRAVRSTITTSSGPGTGGRIFIASPRAIISDGGSILALGQQGGANVQIQTAYFINSADRPNRVAVNGTFVLDAQLGDVSSGTGERDLSILDASGVLRGQCAAARATGRVSQLVIRPVGPYAPSPRGPASGACR